MKRPWCADCGVDTLRLDDRRSEFYMVTDAVWSAAMPHDPNDMTQFLCIGCLESRLGRELCAADFTTDCPMNDLGSADQARYAWSWRTPRLIDRMGRHE